MEVVTWAAVAARQRTMHEERGGFSANVFVLSFSFKKKRKIKIESTQNDLVS